nr:HAD family hydrolase [uncultured Methanospirillum sp.]
MTDLDNTLYDFAAAMERASQAVVTLIGRGDPGDLIRGLIFSPYGVESDKALVEYLNLQGLDDEQVLKSACDEFVKIKNQNVIPFPGVVTGILEIHNAGILIAAVTNASAHHAEERLNLIGVRDLFQLVISPECIGRKKPDTEVYRLAAEMMDCPPHRICVLGDNLVNDIAPAQRLGIYGVHARYGDRLPAEFAGGVVADAVVDHFEDVIPILGVSGQKR